MILDQFTYFMVCLGWIGLLGDKERPGQGKRWMERVWVETAGIGGHLVYSVET